MNDQDFVAWLNQAKPGECQPYHVGMLCADRHPTGKRKAEAAVVGKLARAALAAGEDGLCHLLQRRLGEGKYEYIAIRCEPRPVVKREHIQLRVLSIGGAEKRRLARQDRDNRMRDAAKRGERVADIAKAFNLSKEYVGEIIRS